MKSILSILSLVMLSLLAVADDPKPKLDGSWELAKQVIAGNDMPEELVKTFKIVIKGSEWAIKVQGHVQKGIITLNDATNPKRLKLEAKDGPDAGKTLLCIYELTKDELIMCFDLEGKEYPTEFKSSLGSKPYYEVYKRSKQHTNNFAMC